MAIKNNTYPPVHTKKRKLDKHRAKRSRGFKERVLKNIKHQKEYNGDSCRNTREQFNSDWT